MLKASKFEKPSFKFKFYSVGTNLKAIRSKLPAPAIAARMRPKSVGMVLDAKNIADNPTSMVTKVNTEDF